MSRISLADIRREVRRVCDRHGLLLVLDRERPTVRVLSRDFSPAAAFGTIRPGEEVAGD